MGSLDQHRLIRSEISGDTSFSGISGLFPEQTNALISSTSSMPFHGFDPVNIKYIFMAYAEIILYFLQVTRRLIAWKVIFLLVDESLG